MTISQQPLDQELIAPLSLPEPANDDTAAEPSLARRFLNARTLVSFGFAAAILLFVFTRLNINLGQIWGQIRQADPTLLIAAFGIYYLGFPLRAWRWKLLLQNVHSADGEGAPTVHYPSIGRLTEILLIGWFGNCIVPAKIGDVYRAYLLKQDSAVSFARTAGTVVAERVIDLIILFALLVVSALGVLRVMTSEHAAVTEWILLFGLVLSVTIILGLLALRFGGHHIERILPARLFALWAKFQHGIIASFRASQLPLLTVLTVGIWLTEAGRLYLVTRSMGAEIGIAVVVFVALANSLLTAVPATPGGLGVVEAGVIGIFSLIGVDDTLAASITVLDRAISYWSLIVIGFLAYLFAFRRRR